MSKININGKDFTVEELNALIEEAKKPKFVNEGKYHLQISTDGNWHERYYAGNWKWKNHYQTQEEAERHTKYFQLFTDLYFFAKEHNDGWIPYWSDDNQIKWGIEISKNIEIYETFVYPSFLFGISFKSKEIAEKALEQFKDRLTDYLNIQQ